MKTGKFRTKEQKEAVCRAMKCVVFAGGLLIGSNGRPKIQESFDQTIEAQKWLQIALGITPKEEYFPSRVTHVDIAYFQTINPEAVG